MPSNFGSQLISQLLPPVPEINHAVKSSLSLPIQQPRHTAPNQSLFSALFHLVAMPLHPLFHHHCQLYLRDASNILPSSSSLESSFAHHHPKPTLEVVTNGLLSLSLEVLLRLTHLAQEGLLGICTLDPRIERVHQPGLGRPPKNQLHFVSQPLRRRHKLVPPAEHTALCLVQKPLRAVQCQYLPTDPRLHPHVCPASIRGSDQLQLQARQHILSLSPQLSHLFCALCPSDENDGRLRVNEAPPSPLQQPKLVLPQRKSRRPSHETGSQAPCKSLLHS